MVSVFPTEGMKMKIKVEELCYVNGNLGTYDRKTRIFVGINGTDEGVYVCEHNLNLLSTVEYVGGSKVEIRTLTPVEVLGIENAIGKMKIAKSQAVALLECKVFRGDF